MIVLLINITRKSVPEKYTYHRTRNGGGGQVEAGGGGLVEEREFPK